MDCMWLNFSKNSLKWWLTIFNHHLDQCSQLSHFPFFSKKNVSGCPCHPTLLWRVPWNCPSPFPKTDQLDANACFRESKGDSWFPGLGVDSVCSGKAQGRTILVIDKWVKCLIAPLGGVPSTWINPNANVPTEVFWLMMQNYVDDPIRAWMDFCWKCVCMLRYISVYFHSWGPKREGRQETRGCLEW